MLRFKRNFLSKNLQKIKVAIICGGPSLERGISLNSARSALDHLESESIEIVPIYFDSKKKPYKISKAQLYSNTPSDFDFKLQQTATPLNEKSLVKLLKQVDVAMPVMHGPFGEDGEIQTFLEKNEIPFTGSPSEACKMAFDKFTANEFIQKQGFYALPSALLKIYHKDHKKILDEFFAKHNIKRAIVKPASGGSSIGVFSVGTPEEALEKVELLFSKRMDTRVVVEPFATGNEFTVIVLQNKFGLPVALPPTEIETDYTEHQIFDFRKKYLPTRRVAYHCPPRFSDAVIEKIQAQAEQLFTLFGMRDFARFDGWYLLNGNIWFCDFNPISGMEQNSFLFQQSSRIGMTHSDILRHVVSLACKRSRIHLGSEPKVTKQRKPVSVIFGGENSERQVSLMSGTNVWLKLRRSKKYEPRPYLIDTKGQVWQVPYQLCLNHTVEEIAENCENYPRAQKRLQTFEDRARLHLGLTEEKNTKEFFEPKKVSMKELLDSSHFVFLALHGGKGEDGTMQQLLADRKILFNGPDAKTSRLCMDKWETSEFVRALDIPHVTAIPGKALEAKKVIHLKKDEVEKLWKSLRKELKAKTLIVKPRADGCTTGIAHLFSANDLAQYLKYMGQEASYIPKNTFQGQLDILEMPATMAPGLLFEKFIETDSLHVRGNVMKHTKNSGLVEITIGVIQVGEKIHAFNPSITIAEGEVLSVEEKFQGGTGVNITPPPSNLMKPAVLTKVRERIETLAEKIGITGYSRIDAFVSLVTGDLMIIEVNTLPGLTPSTVLYHQGLAEEPAIFPRELLEKLIENKGF